MANGIGGDDDFSPAAIGVMMLYQRLVHRLSGHYLANINDGHHGTGYPAISSTSSVSGERMSDDSWQHYQATA